MLQLTGAVGGTDQRLGILWRQPCGTGLGALGVLGGMNPSFGGLVEAVETWKILGDESVNSWPLLANF